MKNIGYNVLKNWIKQGLYLYYGKIKISGLENVPKDAPVLFLGNHQGALLDVLLIGVDCNRKPFFLTRSDVFKKPVLKKFFAYLRMIPIYRIRDGRQALKNNEAVFDQCAELFRNNHAILMFPEANHNIKRRVRPLSKGFIRILINALEQTPDLAIHIVPVGLNYKNNGGFPDKVSLIYGEPIIVNTLDASDNVKGSVNHLKKAVSDKLKTLTTHIEHEENYENIVGHLNDIGVDYLNPFGTNEVLKNLKINNKVTTAKSSTNAFSILFKSIFHILNFPVVLLWRICVKPKVWEPEFMGTMRFGFSMLIYPIYYLILFIILALVWNTLTTLAVVFGLFLFNWAYARFN